MTVPTPRPRPHLAPPGWTRRGRLAALIAAVAAMHAWLIGPLQQPLGHPAPREPAIQWVTLPAATAPVPAAQAQAPEPAPGPLSAAAPAATPPPDAARAEPDGAEAGRQPLPADRPADEGPVDWKAGPRPPESATGAETPEPDEAASADAAAAPVPGPVAGAQANDDGGAPPVYTTERPTHSFRVDYRVEHGDEEGVGQLTVELQDEGRQYRARLYGGTGGGRQVLDWVSRGGFDRAGIAPQRMVERQRGIDQRAVNFQRDQGIVSFSISTRAMALHPGAQDRLSVLLQLMAIAEAEPGGLRAGQRLRMQVALPHGQSGDWRFEVVGNERITPAGTPIETVRLVREPTQPYDQRIEVWLARDAGHLPVGLRFTQVPSRGAPAAFWLYGPLPDAAAGPRP
jgi:hypothetical protein